MIRTSILLALLSAIAIPAWYLEQPDPDNTANSKSTRETAPSQKAKPLVEKADSTVSKNDDNSKLVFDSPAKQAVKDYKSLGLPEKDYLEFRKSWNVNLYGWTETAILGNPWSNQYDAPRIDYYNPGKNSQGWPDNPALAIQWTPLPNRLLVFLGNENIKNGGQLDRKLTLAEIYKLADSGQITQNGKTFTLYDPAPEAKRKIPVLKLPRNLCEKVPGSDTPQIDWSSNPKNWGDFSPPGPRGWLDEYCEWSIEWVDNKPGGKIKSIMFTCENPAYWMTIWRNDPNIVAELYRKYVDSAVKVEDLFLRDENNNPVMDPTTGRPAYDPTNKWNRGTLRIPGKSGGAIHLTSPPNTLGAEIYLAAAASIKREGQSPSNPQALICCSKYGQNFRNSDPHIGASGNRAAVAGLSFSLTNPVGLYMQMPNWDVYTTPDKQSHPADYWKKFWKITRGHTGGAQGSGMDSILHVVFEVPEELGFTISDLSINGQKIESVGQIAETFHIALRVTGGNDPAKGSEMPCVKRQVESKLQPWPIQLLPASLFEAESPSALPAILRQGTEHTFVLSVDGASQDTTAKNARIQFNRDGVTAKVVEYLKEDEAYVLEISVADDAEPGVIGVRALNPYEKSSVSEETHPFEIGLAYVATKNEFDVAAKEELVSTGPTNSTSNNSPRVAKPMYLPTYDPKSPNFLTGDLTQPTFEQAAVDCFAWQTFIALNWPVDPQWKKDPNKAGEPDRNFSAANWGDPVKNPKKDPIRPTVWETYKPAQEVFLPKGQQPKAWGVSQANTLEKNKQAGFAMDGGQERVIKFQNKFGPNKANLLKKILPLGSMQKNSAAPDDTNEAFGGWLTDQKKKLVWFERFVNRNEFEYILKNGLYDASNQPDFAKKNGIQLPLGKVPNGKDIQNWDEIGAIEIKSAWRILTDCPEEWSRFHLTRAWLCDPETKVCKSEVLGLVGLHILHKGGSFPNFMWATFEHIDNVPTKGAPYKHPNGYSFNDPHSKGIPNVPRVNKKGKPLFPKDQPVQTTRVVNMPDDVIDLNLSVQEQIRKQNSDSVFQYYQLVNVLWQRSPDAGNDLPGLKTPLQFNSIASSGPNSPVANTTMETYIQRRNCTDCHKRAAIAGDSGYSSDFSFLFQTAESSK